MIGINYPAYPGGVDVGQIIGLTERGYDRSVDQRNEAEAKKLLGQYANSLYGQQQGGLAGLNNMFQPAAPAGQVQRAPLPAPMDYASQRVSQAFGDAGAPQVAGQSDLNSSAIAGRFLKTVRDGGVTNPYALAAIAATGKAESRFDPKNATRTWSDPSQSGEAGMAGGIMSWRGPRLAAMQAFAQQNGDDPNAPSPETQAKFLLAEDPSLIQKLQQAKSPEEAQALMNNAWRYAGYDQPGGETAERMASANAYAQQFGGSPSQAALENMAVGQSAPMGQGVQVADASGGVPQGAMPQQMDPSSLLPPRELMAGLFANPVTRPVAIQLAQSVQQLRANAADPLARIKYQTAIAQLQKAQNSGAPKFGNSVVWGQNENGDWVALQPSSAGGLVPADTGGIKLSPPGIGQMNAGTHFVVRDRAGNQIGSVPIDNAGKAADTAAGKAQGEDLATYQSMVSKLPGLEDTVAQLDDLANRATYTSAGQIYDLARKEAGLEPRDAAVARTQYIATVNNQILPLLRDTFGAQFTEREGATLRETLGDPDKSPAEKQAVLKSFIEQKKRDIEALARRTGQQQGGGTDYKSRYGLD